MKVKFQLRPIRNFFEVASLLMGLVVVALVSAIVTMHFAIHGAEVRVPALKGMTVAEARSQTSGLGLNLDVDDRFYSADVAPGHILSQSPAPASVVRREWRVRVAESLGPQKVEVPNVVGGQERAAGLNLRRVGLETGVVATFPYAKATPGTVVAQDPPAKAQGIERPSINLLVAAPDDTTPNGFVMPEMVGWPIAAAEAQLIRVGIKFGEPKYVDAAIPPVTGPGVDSVAGVGTGAGSNATMVGAGSVSSSTVGSASPNPGPSAAPRPPAPMKATPLPNSVVRQEPPAGYRVEVGSTVTLFVAK